MYRLLELIQDPVKAFITVMFGTLFGYTPTLDAMIYKTEITSVNVAFQHTVWTLTSIVALFAIISSVQKQVDRYKQNHPEDNEDED